MKKKTRPRNSVVLDVDLLERLIEDTRKFLSSGAWYVEKGIPYRRGYLTYCTPLLAVAKPRLHRRVGRVDGGGML